MLTINNTKNKKKTPDNCIVYIKDDDGDKVSSVSFSHEAKDKGLSEVELDDKHKFQLIPFKEKERSCLFISGESGAGKSRYALDYCKEYHKMYPKNPIYLISYLEHDDTLDSYDQIIRLDMCDVELIDDINEIDVDESFSNSLVIFDDIDSIHNKKLKNAIYALLNKCLRIGRHFYTSIIYCGHELYANNDLKCIMNECNIIVFFPKFLNFKKMKYLLDVYFGLSKSQIQRIRGIQSRSIAFIKGSPKLILSEREIYILQDDF
jgi:hypothetical protein